MFEYILVALLQGSTTPVIEKFSTKEACEIISMELTIQGGEKSKIKCLPVMKDRR